MFERATKIKLRFNFHGQLAVEDLWDLNAETLDQLYGGLCRASKAQDEHTLLRKRTPQDEIQELRISIVKHIVETKLKERQAREELASVKIRMNKIASVIEKKQDEHLEGMSLDELKKAMADLGGEK